MEQLTILKRLRIKKDELMITIGEKKDAKTKSGIYLGIFMILFAWMIALDPNSVNENNSMNESGGMFLKFISGKFLIVSIFLMYRTSKINKEIRELEKEYEEMKEEIRYLSN
jgi:uncharacterized membrane protein